MTRILAIALTAALTALPAAAQETLQGDPARAEELQLNAEERQSAAEEMERQALEADAAADEDEARIKRIAGEIARYETEIKGARMRLVGLADEEAVAVEALRKRRRMHAAAFSAMIALSKAPGPALIAHQGGAVEAARSAALLGGLRDSLTKEARDTRRRIAEIKDLREAADGARRTAKEAIAALRSREQELWTLVGKRRAEKRTRLSEAELLKQEADELAKQAKALSVLLRRSPTPAPKPQRAVATQPMTRYLSPPRPLTEARGRFAAPVIGDVSADYGGAASGEALGLVYRAKPYSRVYAPWNGVISYAGPVKSFGLVSVIDIGEGHQIVLAGLAALDRQRGDAVLRGEPVGRLAGPISDSDEFLVEHSALDVDAVASLYLQMRRNGEPINPGPWLEKQGL